MYIMEPVWCGVLEELFGDLGFAHDSSINFLPDLG